MLRQLTRAAPYPLFSSRTTAVSSIRLLSDLSTGTSSSAAQTSSPPPQSNSTSPSEPVVRIITITKAPNLPSPEPSPKASTSNSRPLPSEPYLVTRTRTGGLPVYKVVKGSGTLKLTRIRRVDGDLSALRDQLEQYLQPTPKRVEVNQTTRHVVVKGDYRTQVETFLTAKGF